MAWSTRRWCHVSQERFFSMKLFSCWRLAIAFGSRNIFEQITSLQRLDIEEAERRHMQLHSASIQLLLLKQVGLILAQVLRTEPVGRLMEMPGEFLDDPDVGFYGTLSVITTLEFFQHHFAKSGHRDLL